jgi:hypothetical protein
MHSNINKSEKAQTKGLCHFGFGNNKGGGRSAMLSYNPRRRRRSCSGLEVVMPLLCFLSCVPWWWRDASCVGTFSVIRPVSEPKPKRDEEPSAPPRVHHHTAYYSNAATWPFLHPHPLKQKRGPKVIKFLPRPK